MKLNKKYLAPLCSLLVTGGLLVSIAVLTLGSSFGWFSNNDKVSASGISVSSVSPYKTAQALYVKDEATGTLTPLGETANTTLFSKMLPGNKQTVYLEVQNTDNVDLELELLLSAPNNSTSGGTDSGYADGTNYYYLGTQMRVSEIKLATCTKSGDTITCTGTSGNDLRAVSGANAYLLTIPDDAFYPDGLQETAATAKQIQDAFAQASQKKLTNSNTAKILVENGETVYLAITFEFVENNQVQNPYIDFGNKDVANTNSETADRANYVLTRTLLCWYSEAETQE